jgi:hypothetical protein
MYNNHSLWVLCKFNRSTHLLCVVLPNPLTWAVKPANVLEASVATVSATVRMLSEIIKTYVLIETLESNSLTYRSFTPSKYNIKHKWNKFLQLIAPVFTFSRLLLITTSYFCTFHSVVLFIGVWLIYLFIGWLIDWLIDLKWIQVYLVPVHLGF